MLNLYISIVQSDLLLCSYVKQDRAYCAVYTGPGMKQAFYLSYSIFKTWEFLENLWKMLHNFDVVAKEEARVVALDALKKACRIFVCSSQQIHDPSRAMHAMWMCW